MNGERTEHTLPVADDDVRDERRAQVFDAHLNVELSRFMRHRLVYAVAFMSSAVWVVAMLPAAIPDGVRSFVLFGWVLCASAAAIFALREARARRIRAVLSVRRADIVSSARRPE